MMRYLAVIALLLLAACSPPQRIARANNAIRGEAREQVLKFVLCGFVPICIQAE